MAVVNHKQIAEKSILDCFNRQAYLGNSYIAYVENNSIASTSETPLMLIQNPATSVKSLFHGVRRVSCQTAAASAVFRIYLNPTVTAAGSSYTPVNQRVLSGANNVALVSTLPTVSANGALIELLPALGFYSSLSNTLVNLDPSQKLLVTLQLSAALASVSLQLGWYEL